MLDQDWLSCFAALGVVEASNSASARWRPSGACVFVEAHGLSWLVTANHVLPQSPLPQMALRLDVGVATTLVPLWEAHAGTPGIGWIRNQDTDLAICPFPVLPGARVKTVPEKLFVPADLELTSMACLTGGCPLGLPGLDPARAMPIVLDGIVAGVDRGSKRLFITAPTYPGNSGGPVFVEQPLHNAVGGIDAGRPTTLLAGIVLQSGKIEASGYSDRLSLGVAASIELVKELLESSEAHQQAVIARGAA